MLYAKSDVPQEQFAAPLTTTGVYVLPTPQDMVTPITATNRATCFKMPVFSVVCCKCTPPCRDHNEILNLRPIESGTQIYLSVSIVGTSITTFLHFNHDAARRVLL